MTEMIDRMEQELWPDGASRSIWMIVDPARDKRVFPLLLDCHLEYSCLYSGKVSPTLEAAAPYLVQLEQGYRDTKRLLTSAWGNSWGILLKSDTSLRRLRDHLRGFLMVRDPGGRRLVFRYYDPRVMRVYLPSCNREELDTVFGPVQRFWTESEDPGAILEFDYGSGQLVEAKIPLSGVGERSVPRSKRAEDVELAGRSRKLPLTIRREQMARFGQNERQKFEVWMFDHLGRFFPRQCAAAGEDGVRKMIREGIERAAEHGIKSRRGVCKYLDLMFALGRDFEKDSRFPQAENILRQPIPPDTRVDSLVNYAKIVLRRSASRSA